MIKFPRGIAVGLLFVAVLGADGPVGAQALPAGDVRLTMVDEHLDLEPPRADELVGAAEGRRTAAKSAEATVDGHGLRVALPSPAQPIVGTFRRVIPRLWQVETAPGIGLPQVTLRLESRDGVPNRMACREDPALQVVAYLRPFGVVSSIGPDGMGRCEGGAILEIPTTSFIAACHLEGRIIAVLENW